MALSNTATPIYYGRFRDAVIRGEIPVCIEISMEMNRIDSWIENPGIWYDDQAILGFVSYCENELTLTDGENLHLLDSFKLWAEQIFGWYYFVDRSIYVPGENGQPGHYENRRIKKRLIKKQYLIVARGAAKSMYSELFSERRYIDHSSSNNSSHYGTGGRGNVTNPNCHNEGQRSFISVSYRGFVTEYNWIKS